MKLNRQSSLAYEAGRPLGEPEVVGIVRIPFDVVHRHVLDNGNIDDSTEPFVKLGMTVSERKNRGLTVQRAGNIQPFSAGYVHAQETVINAAGMFVRENPRQRRSRTVEIAHGVEEFIAGIEIDGIVGAQLREDVLTHLAVHGITAKTGSIGGSKAITRAFVNANLLGKELSEDGVEIVGGIRIGVESAPAFHSGTAPSHGIGKVCGHLNAGRSGWRIGKQDVIEIVGVNLPGDLNLFEVAETTGALGFDFCLMQCREKQSGQSRNYSDNHEQFNQGEAAMKIARRAIRRSISYVPRCGAFFHASTGQRIGGVRVSVALTCRTAAARKRGILISVRLLNQSAVPPPGFAARGDDRARQIMPMIRTGRAAWELCVWQHTPAFHCTLAPIVE